MKYYLTRLVNLILLFVLFVSCAQPKERIRASFNQNWQFLKGDTEQEHLSTFDDSSWRTLDLPHDWAIEGPFDKANDARTGGLPI